MGCRTERGIFVSSEANIAATLQLYRLGSPTLPQSRSLSSRSRYGSGTARASVPFMFSRILLRVPCASFSCIARPRQKTASRSRRPVSRSVAPCAVYVPVAFCQAFPHFRLPYARSLRPANAGRAADWNGAGVVSAFHAGSRAGAFLPRALVMRRHSPLIQRRSLLSALFQTGASCGSPEGFGRTIHSGRRSPLSLWFTTQKCGMVRHPAKRRPSVGIQATTNRIKATSAGALDRGSNFTRCRC